MVLGYEGCFFATLAANKPMEIIPCPFDDLQEQSLLVLTETGALLVDGPPDDRGASEREPQGVASAKECTRPVR